MAGRKHYLSHLEEVIILAIRRLEPKAYGLVIQKEVSEALGHEVSHGVVYGVLGGLERIGYIRSTKGDLRKGSHMRYYEVKVVAVETLKAMSAVRKKLGGDLD